MFPGTYIKSFIKIVSVTTEILLTLVSVGVGGWGVVYKVIFVSNPTKAMLG